MPKLFNNCLKSMKKIVFIANETEKRKVYARLENQLFVLLEKFTK